MNLKEIKQRAEAVKNIDHAHCDIKSQLNWASDTIMHLVAEVEHTKKEYREYIDERHIESMEYAQRCDDYKIKIEKLTAANKIMREGLGKVVDKYFDLPVEQRMVPQLKESQNSIVARKTIAEADEVMK